MKKIYDLEGALGVYPLAHLKAVSEKKTEALTEHLGETFSHLADSLEGTSVTPQNPDAFLSLLLSWTGCEFGMSEMQCLCGTSLIQSAYDFALNLEPSREDETTEKPPLSLSSGFDREVHETYHFADWAEYLSDKYSAATEDAGYDQTDLAEDVCFVLAGYFAAVLKHKGYPDPLNSVLDYFWESFEGDRHKTELWQKLYERYLEDGKPEEYLEDFAELAPEVTAKPQLINCFPVVESSGVCPSCGVYLTHKRPSKSALNGRSPGYHQACPETDCSHIDTSKQPDFMQRNCDCDYCFELRETAKIKRTEEIKAGAAKAFVKPPVDLLELNQKELIHLFSVIVARCNEEMTLLYPLSSEQNQLLLAPTIEMAREGVVWPLVERRAIVPDIERSDAKAFVPPSEDNKYWCVYPNDVYLKPNVTINGDDILDIVETFRAVNDLLQEAEPDWQETIIPLWKKIAQEECVQISEHYCDDHNLPFSADSKKLRENIDIMLADYSVAQIYSLAYRSSRDAAAYMNSNSSKRWHQKDGLYINRLLKSAQTALANDWETKPFQRMQSVPRSVLSQMLFDLFLKWEGDKGFYLCPGKFKPPISTSKEDSLPTELSALLAHVWEAGLNGRSIDELLLELPDHVKQDIPDREKWEKISKDFLENLQEEEPGLFF